MSRSGGRAAVRALGAGCASAGGAGASAGGCEGTEGRDGATTSGGGLSSGSSATAAEREASDGGGGTGWNGSSSAPSARTARIAARATGSLLGGTGRALRRSGVTAGWAGVGEVRTSAITASVGGGALARGAAEGGSGGGIADGRRAEAGRGGGVADARGGSGGGIERGGGTDRGGTDADGGSGGGTERTDGGFGVGGAGGIPESRASRASRIAAALSTSAFDFGSSRVKRSARPAWPRNAFSLWARTRPSPRRTVAPLASVTSKRRITPVGRAWAPMRITLVLPTVSSSLSRNASSVSYGRTMRTAIGGRVFSATDRGYHERLRVHAERHRAPERCEPLAIVILAVTGVAMARILIIGGGAREHALGRGLVSTSSHELLFAPGNAGTLALGRNVPVPIGDVDRLVELAAAERVDLVVVGPELPLTLGVVDALAARGIPAFGPSKAAARLEGSKAFMKDVCKRAGVPTADFAVFDDAEAAKEHVRRNGRPLVVKADGLCAGKGVVVAASVEEACAAIDRMIALGELGDAGKTVVLEELLPGEEASFHVVCDGTRAVPLVAAQDHKRVFDGDAGPNTGGMGAYAPAPVVDEAVAAEVMRAVVEPTLRTMSELGVPFRGVLFVGLMIDAGKPRVLEFNVRFGDPETTVIVPLYGGDWFELLDGAARGAFRFDAAPPTRAGAALAVVMAAEKYPASPATGDRIEGLGAALADGVHVYHAGTRRDGDSIVTAGGRVLTVSAHAPSLAAARDAAYAAVERIRWRGEHHRADIGHRALR